MGIFPISSSSLAINSLLYEYPESYSLVSTRTRDGIAEKLLVEVRKTRRFGVEGRERWRGVSLRGREGLRERDFVDAVAI
jgi:hypothetical protein